MIRVVDWKKLPVLNLQAVPPENLLDDMLTELLESDPPSLEPEIETVYPTALDLEIPAPVEVALSELSQSVCLHFATEPEPPAVVGEALSCEPPPVVNLEVDDLLALLLSAESTGASDQGSNPDCEAESSAPKSSAYSAPGPPVNRDSCLVFSLGGEKIGIPIRQVIELDRLPRITPVPNVPYWVRGVTNLRGEIMPVLDLGILLGMVRSEPQGRGRILVVRIGEDLTAALVVDEVNGFVNLEQDRLSPYVAGEGEKVSPLLQVIYSTEDLALKVLNMDKLMAVTNDEG